MELTELRDFLFWCTLIDGSLLVFWIGMMMLAPDLVYRTQRRWFPLSQETFTLVMYAFLAAWKIGFLMLNLVPLLALFIVTHRVPV